MDSRHGLVGAAEVDLDASVDGELAVPDISLPQIPGPGSLGRAAVVSVV